jgi:hypothetical protein
MRMSFDYAMLWLLVMTDTLAILLLVRQLATLPQFSRRSGPQAGTPIEPWSLEMMDGGTRRSTDLAEAYTLLFVASTCGPCHALFEEMRSAGRPRGLLYVVAQGDAAALEKEAVSERGPMYDLFFRGGRGDLYQRLNVPGTPFAVAVRKGRIEAAGPAASTEQLFRVSDAQFGVREVEPTTV